METGCPVLDLHNQQFFNLGVIYYWLLEAPLPPLSGHAKSGFIKKCLKIAVSFPWLAASSSLPAHCSM